jgi:beta-lactamase superfamily II metal-dependent hydrolase
MAKRLRVRMYDVGFGDAFLLEFPTTRVRPFRVLVDCGSHFLGHPPIDGWSYDAVVGQIIEDISDHGDPTLDVIVVSHRHQDHVEGFESELWNQVHVGEVWLPWTEGDDAKAKKLRGRIYRSTLALDRAFASEGFARRWADAERANALRAMVRNSLKNDKAMGMLLDDERFAAGPDARQFLSLTDPLTVLRPSGCPRLKVHVLGPSREESVIRDMDPPDGESYLRFLPADSGVPGCVKDGEFVPFGRHFVLDEATYGVALDPEIKAAAASMMRDDDLAAAVAIDKAANGTSLLLVFEFGDAVLTFPGDAQWGTWKGALAVASDLLARTTFLKIGHHGSHNATPVSFVESLGGELDAAVASVFPIDVFPEIPRNPILDELRDKGVRLVVRSDEPGDDEVRKKVRPGIGIDFNVQF